MGKLAIARIKRSANIWGYRIIDTETHETADMSCGDMVRSMRLGDLSVENMELAPNNKIRVLMGSPQVYNNFPFLDGEGKEIGKKGRHGVKAVFILGKSQDRYTLCDGKGHVFQEEKDSVEDNDAIGVYVVCNLFRNKLLGTVNCNDYRNMDKNLGSYDEYIKRRGFLGNGAPKCVEDNFGMKLLEWPEKDHGEVVIPEFITVIGSNAFQKCGDITSIVCGTGVQEIKERGLETTGIVTSIRLNEGLLRISGRIFGGEARLEELVIPTTVRRIGPGAFNMAQINKLYVMSENLEVNFDGMVWLSQLKLRHNTESEIYISHDAAIKALTFYVREDNREFLKDTQRGDRTKPTDLQVKTGVNAIIGAYKEVQWLDRIPEEAIDIVKEALGYIVNGFTGKRKFSTVEIV